ncbi:DUF732 domain-containing protein [Mycolicibacterium farcinogenes]|uniref:DUF732 domain-containing protein n=1 Tax=Mycolicibacterium farcinogenes TaxID=1802 RepID=UPI001C8F0A52|nr:DUF732 domain-containing protein [Mycolicibacterium farcinogenes]QZH61246.1 DUF732 domain-containing protein [Mycolicibacterium farcinogenes]
MLTRQLSRANRRPYVSKTAALGIALFMMPLGAVIAAAPAHACTDSDDVNTLCSNEQLFVDDLAAVGIVPTDTPRRMVNRGQLVCGQLASNIPRSVVVQKVYGSAAMRLNQAEAIVAAAQQHLCPFTLGGTS